LTVLIAGGALPASPPKEKRTNSEISAATLARFHVGVLSGGTLVNNVTIPLMLDRLYS
jgi:hypothetical protein